jgi:hypothetical protein
MSHDKAAGAGKLVYLQCVELSEICFLQEVLYWVAFARLPFQQSIRESRIDGYKTDVPYNNGELEYEECERAGLPPDPRLDYMWAIKVLLSDGVEEIVASLESDEELTEDEASKKQAQSEAAELRQKLNEWKPKFERAIELAAAKVYAALREGRLTSKGVRLPDPDVAVSLKVLAEQETTVGELEDVAIPKDAWSLPHIYWEISAARNDDEHYCQIRCPTAEVMSLFPHDSVAAGEPLDGLAQHGSFFVLSSNSVAPARRSQSRGRGRGRPSEYRWDDLHLEMAALVLDELPPKKDATVEYLRELCGKRGWPVPATRTLYGWLEPYYARFGANSDR